MFLKKKDFVSVIIPAYNHEKFVGKAVESVLKQSWEHLELIVINDGSTDRTGDIVQGFSDTRLKYFDQENQDAYNTINRGLHMARGDFIAILNSDDVYPTNRLERLLKVQKKTRAACIFTDVQPITENGDEILDYSFGWHLWHQKNRDYYKQCGDLYTAFLKGNFMVTTSNLFMRKDAVKRVGDFCTLRYLHDYDYIFRLMLNFPDQVIYLEDEKLLYYRIHGGSTLSEAAIVGREQDKEVIRRYMMAKIPDALKSIVETGVDRLVELENELFTVRAEIEAGAK